MQALYDFGIFTAKSLLVAVLVLIILINVSRVLATLRSAKRTLVIDYRRAVRRNADALRRATMTPTEAKRLNKEAKQQRKSKSSNGKPRIWVLEFDGDVKASGVPRLKDEVTAVLSVARPQDEVMVRINSNGGTVIAYGLAAVHLDRIRKANLKLTAAVDEAAASGGYLMAAVANEIIAAPFSVLGSIGVIATVPNAHKLLQEKGVEIHEFTAGNYKRTATPFGEVTEDARRKLLEQLSEILELFKDFVAVRRPSLSIEDVATGEYWFGTRAHELQLIDHVQTSDEWMLERLDSHDIYIVRTSTTRQGIMQHADRLMKAVLSRITPAAEYSKDNPMNLPRI